MEELYGISGLTNLNNTCYLNSILQCLSNSYPLKKFILSSEFINHILIYNEFDNENESDIENFLNSKLSYQFRKLIVHIWKYKYEEIEYWKPTSFKNVFCKKNNIFNNENQHDSHEALNSILDIFNEELSTEIIIKLDDESKYKYKLFDSLLSLNDIDIKSLKYNINKYKNEYLLYIYYKKFKDYYTKKYSIINEILGGMLISTIVCPITNIPSINFEPFNILSLSIPDDDDDDDDKLNIISIYDCLDLLIDDEELDNDNKWFSKFANEKVNARKKIQIWDAPEILIIHFKRFKQTLIDIKKNKSIIDFPIIDLDISKYINDYNKSDKEYKYDLFAINNHTDFNMDIFSFGHYFSYCKNEIDNKWFNFDDEKVSEIDIKEIDYSLPYILFYIKK